MPVPLGQRHYTQFQGATDLGRMSHDEPCVVGTASFGHADENESVGSTTLGFATVLLAL